ncbi:GerMN domain-containing protein [Fervidibacillus halotolerans]|uniref:GerMN domain-containing protein n=1 Tax=Fervidibacillus halotolerans TaxID=2980027 RepID=A0A9E8RXD1_9BACI|nr:GerMN domain-containing protein [Fervidibacillus halotolerans]WAA11611.1 GerMN domain-containing protein [Fervidibacillus halotolerans]
MRKWTWILFVFLLFPLILSGCFGLSGKEEIDPPETVNYEEEIGLEENEGQLEENESEQSTSVQTELYLIDKNGYVVPKTFSLPITESVAKQALEYLVEGGPITNLLPDDFRAVLPAGTEMSIDIKDGIATIDFSKEFKEYAPEDELRILQSVTWTMTQFETVDAVKLQINGTEITEMPVNKTPIQPLLSRKSGINFQNEPVVDVTNTYPITVYYVAQTDENYYYVPVTKRISNKREDKARAIIEELIKGPDMKSELFTLLMPDVQLLEDPIMNDGVVTVNFNENILGSYDKKLITSPVLDTIVLSLTEEEGIESVSVQVKGETNLVTQEGEPLTLPVSRPKIVNASSF